MRDHTPARGGAHPYAWGSPPNVGGLDSIMWEPDSLRSICAGQNPQQVVDGICADIPQHTRRKMVSENAIKLYHLS